MSQLHQPFHVQGPYPIPYDQPRRGGTSKRITLGHAADFWSSPEMNDLRDARGCYVFALGVSGGFTPWYVGKTCKGFAAETFQDHKLVRYNDVVFGGNKGTPVMFFVVWAGADRHVPKAEIDDVETYLIQSAVFKNPRLKNKLKAKFPHWGIKGVVRGGRGNAPNSAKRLRGMLGL